MRTQEISRQATGLLESGRLREARELYLQVSRLEPDDTDAWLMLGAINGELGEVEEAIRCCQCAIKLESENIDAHVVLGRILASRGSFNEAASCFLEALRLDPEYGEVWNMLAGVNGQQGLYKEAERCSREAIRTLPDQVNGYVNLSSALLALGRAADAAEACSNALVLSPNNPTIWSLLGQARERVGSIGEAIQAFSRAIALDPKLIIAQVGMARALQITGDLAGANRLLKQTQQQNPADPSVYMGLGSLCLQERHFDQAEINYRHALQLKPDFVEAWVDLGNLMQTMERYEESESCYRQALTYSPGNADAYFNQGVSYQRRGRLIEALTSFDLAIEGRPDFVDAHWYKSFICLQKGDYARGWDEYEWRLRQTKNASRPFHQPTWDGSALAGRTILVHDEQGYGDTFQFVRYLPMLEAYGGEVIFECHKNLSPVLWNCGGFKKLVERTAADVVPELQFDVQIHLMSVPRVLKTRLDTVPNQVPYIYADPVLVERWRERISHDPGFKIGIAWAGSSNHTNEHNRSCKLSEFSSLASLPGVSLYSLQKGPGAEQADEPPPGMKLIRVDKELDQSARFVDTAALMANLDLVISIDTSIVHLAGALGRPVWTLLCANPDWRWLQDRNDTPWYPTMRLFRQTEPGDWQAVFTQCHKALQVSMRNENT